MRDRNLFPQLMGKGEKGRRLRHQGTGTRFSPGSLFHALLLGLALRLEGRSFPVTLATSEDNASQETSRPLPWGEESKCHTLNRAKGRCHLSGHLGC